MILEIFRAPNGDEFTCRFDEDEGAAVVTGPMPPRGTTTQVHEFYRENAKDADDAREKLRTWRRARGLV